MRGHEGQVVSAIVSFAKSVRPFDSQDHSRWTKSFSALLDGDGELAICRDTAKLYPNDISARIQLAFGLYAAGKGEQPENAEPLFREALQELDEMQRAETLPKANENWAPFIRERLVQIEAGDGKN